MTTLYVPHKSAASGFRDHPIDPARCRAQTYNSVTRNFSQCARNKVVEVGGVGYCQQHSPDGVAKREAARREKERAEQLARAKQWKRPLEYRDTLRLIAAGHNDPRALAKEILAKWDEADAP